MKKLYALISVLFIALTTNATVHTITVADFSFTPATTNAVCGDTIEWVWVSGDHTTWADTVPDGANAWVGSSNPFNTLYSQQLTVAGYYHYYCYLHPMMTGNIVVTCPTGISSVDKNYFSSAYPNPFSSKLTIETSAADAITLYNLTGKKIKTVLLQPGQERVVIDAADLIPGIYLYCIIREKVVVEIRRVVKIN